LYGPPTPASFDLPPSTLADVAPMAVVPMAVVPMAVVPMLAAALRPPSQPLLVAAVVFALI